MDSGGIDWIIVNSTVLFTVFSGVCVLLLIYILRVFKSDSKNEYPVKHELPPVQPEKRKEAAQKSKKKGADSKWTGRTDKQGFTHPWMVGSLKGHTDQVLDMDFSANGKYLASCAEDRTVLLWDVRDLIQKEHKSIRINIEFDHATFVKWSPDSRAFIIQRYHQNNVEVYKVEKKKDGWLGPASKALSFPKTYDDDVIGLGISCNGKYIMTCTNKTDMIIWDLKGEQLAHVDTYLMSTTCAKISPCGRFVVASGFAPEAKVWEVRFTKTGEFQEVKRAFELTGHTSGVYDVAFDVNSSHMATVSKDGTWKLFNTKVEYTNGQDPVLLVTGTYRQTAGRASIALSPNADVVVIATANILYFYDAWTTILDATIEFVCSGHIRAIAFDSSGKYLLSAGDRVIRIFHNVTGVRCDIQSAKEKLKQSQTSATKERLQKVVHDGEAFLKTIKG